MVTRARPPLAVVDRACAAHGRPAQLPLAGPTLDEDELVRRTRERFNANGLPALAPDEAACGHLRPGERLLALEHATLVAGAGGITCPTHGGGFGRVYVTTERLVHVPCGGATPLALPLETVHDAAVTTGRLLLVLDGGGGVALETPWPRLLRLQVGMARAQRSAARREQAAGPVEAPAP